MSWCSTDLILARYNMIFVETSAKDATGVEQVNIIPRNHIHVDCGSEYLGTMKTHSLISKKG